jgi:polar amino acid transport system substrate-binding protein
MKNGLAFGFLFLIAAGMILFSQEKPVMRYSGAADWYPIFPADADNRMTDRGVGIEMMNELGLRLGVRVELIRDIPWLRLWDMMDEGTVDFVVGAGGSDERRRAYIEIEPFMMNDYRLFVKTGREFAFTRMEDLKGKTIAMRRGGKYGTEFDDFVADPANGVTIYETDGSKPAAFPMVDLGRADCTPSDIFDGMHWIGENGYTGHLVPLPKTIGESSVYIYLSRKSPWVPFADQVSRAIRAMKEDGTMERIMARY